MAVATHLGPWLLGTVKDTTGTTAGTIRNIGATPVQQYKAITFADATAATQAFVLPAGAFISAFSFITTTVFSAATTIKCSIGATDLTAATTITSVAPANMAIASTSGATALAVNVGSTDAIVTFTLVPGVSTTGAGTLVVAYTVRNSDGTYGAAN